MPKYQIIRASTQNVITRASSVEEAQRLVDGLTRVNNEKYFFKPEPDKEWRLRETLRFANGEYKAPPWRQESWWTQRSQELIEHYAHRSSEKPEMIAFTESEEKGELDRQTRMRAGAYLQRFFSDHLTESEIHRWAQIMARSVCDDTPAMQIASTPQHIVEVYLHGPESCMSLDVTRYVSRPIHPVEVYGDSDLAVAYVERRSAYHSERIASRALIWPEMKIYGRVYPTPERYSGTSRELALQEQNALMRALESVGYTQGTFSGARIRAIKAPRGSEDEYVMPYLDGNYSLDLSGDESWFIMSRHGEFHAQNTHGTINTDESSRCEYCEDSTDEDDLHTVNVAPYESQQWCDSCCSNNAFWCNGHEEYYSDDRFTCIMVDGESYCEEYAQDNFAVCDRTGDWFATDDCVIVRVSGGGFENWCRDEADSYAFCCELTDEYYSDDDFESVAIDGRTYEKSAAMRDDKLRAKIEELESEETEQ